MKKRLNFITFLIGIAIGISILNSEFIQDFKEGFVEGQNAARDNYLEMTKRTYYLSLAPIINYSMPDKLLNIKSGELLPSRIKETQVKINVGKEGIMQFLWMFPFSVLMITGFIMFVFNFIKIILAVNKSVIFEWINVKRLRRISIGFTIMFIVDAIVSIILNNFLLKLIELENYKIVNTSYEGLFLLLGMVSFLVAEIFAVGLKLKEEQELTI